MRTCVRVFAAFCTLVSMPARGAEQGLQGLEEEPVVLEPITVTATP